MGGASFFCDIALRHYGFVDKIFESVDGLFVKGQTSSALNLGDQTTALSETFGNKHPAKDLNGKCV